MEKVYKMPGYDLHLLPTNKFKNITISLKLQNTLEISNENEKYIYTQHVALKELVHMKNKNRKNKTIIDDINQLRTF